MIVDPKIPADLGSLKAFLAEKDIGFFDFGCSTGGGTKWAESVIQRPGLGFDIDAQKIEKASESGVICCNFDILQLPKKKLVDQTIIFHMLEHLGSVSEASKFITKAVQVSSERVVIRQPYFDMDSMLFRLGYKTYYSHWSGHKNLMATPSFWFILNKLRQSGSIKEFAIAYRGPIVSSSDPVIHPLDSPINSAAYDPQKHPPKIMDIRFEFPLFSEIVVDIDVSGSGSGEMLKKLAPNEVCFDSKLGVDVLPGLG